MPDKEPDIWGFLDEIPDLPADGLKPPAMENMRKEETIKDGESPVVLQKIVTEVYIYTSADTNDLWYGAQSFQDVQVLGTMRLSEALSRISTFKKRRRRK